MDGLALVTAATKSSSVVGLACVRPHPPSCISPQIRTKRITLRRKSRKFVVLASKDDSKLDPWIQMELKFGQMLGEDPKLTMAKIMAKKSDPDASYLAVEKAFYNKKGKSAYEDVEEVPFDTGTDTNTDSKISAPLGGLNLIRPVPKNGVKFEIEIKSAVSDVKKPSQSIKKPIDNNRSSIPNVILRKPTIYVEDDDIGSSKIRMKPNLSFSTGNEQKRETFSDITLLKRPAPFTSKVNLDDEQEPNVEGRTRTEGDDGIEMSRSIDATILRHPERMDVSLTSGDDKDNAESTEEFNGKNDTIESLTSSSAVPAVENEPAAGLQPIESSEEEATEKTPDEDSESRFSMEAALLQGKPTRMDQSLKEPPTPNTEETGIQSAGVLYDSIFEFQSFVETSPIKEHEDIYWSKAEELNRTGGREEVDLISASTRGFVVSFGSLIGFLPYRNLVARWKFLAFESWLRRKGLDPSKYRQTVGIVVNSNSDKNLALDTHSASNIDQKFEEDMKLDDLSRIYDQEKLRFLSSFVGQKIKVNVVLADRKSRKLVFSIKPKEKEEMLMKKRNLMAQLSSGDVVKCCIKKITYFGIFVEIDDVPALIHQTEVSWDATLDPASYFKVGQTVEAKVHKLDFALERIFLSLKEITPDPLSEALEAVIGDPTSLDGRLEAAQADTELSGQWADVESLIQELEKFEGIQSVSKGRFFLSPGLAPTFQVYMASMFENEYKLLARAEKRVQEVIVETSLGKEELKKAITTCTNRVE